MSDKESTPIDSSEEDAGAASSVAEIGWLNSCVTGKRVPSETTGRERAEEALRLNEARMRGQKEAFQSAVNGGF